MQIPSKVFAFFPATINSETRETHLVSGSWQNGFLFTLAHTCFVTLNKLRASLGYRKFTFPVTIKQEIWDGLDRQTQFAVRDRY